MGDLSRHFDRAEFACRCGCGFDTVDAELVLMLEEIRKEFERPVYVTSGCRCPEHNQHVGGSPNSQHLKGRAADIQVKGVEPWQVQEFIESELVPSGLGKYDSFTHIDSRSGNLSRWEG